MHLFDVCLYTWSVEFYVRDKFYVPNWCHYCSCRRSVDIYLCKQIYVPDRYGGVCPIATDFKNLKSHSRKSDAFKDFISRSLFCRARLAFHEWLVNIALKWVGGEHYIIVGNWWTLHNNGWLVNIALQLVTNEHCITVGDGWTLHYGWWGVNITFPKVRVNLTYHWWQANLGSADGDGWAFITMDDEWTLQHCERRENIDYSGKQLFDGQLKGNGAH